MSSNNEKQKRKRTDIQQFSDLLLLFLKETLTCLRVVAVYNISLVSWNYVIFESRLSNILIYFFWCRWSMFCLFTARKRNTIGLRYVFVFCLDKMEILVSILSQSSVISCAQLNNLNSAVGTLLTVFLSSFYLIYFCCILFYYFYLWGLREGANWLD